jgi:hypothetical protein
LITSRKSAGLWYPDDDFPDDDDDSWLWNIKIQTSCFGSNVFFFEIYLSTNLFMFDIPYLVSIYVWFSISISSSLASFHDLSVWLPIGLSAFSPYLPLIDVAPSTYTIVYIDRFLCII